MTTFKYIIIDQGAILFNENTTHKQVARGFDKVYSAGFVGLELNSLPTESDIKPYGRSASLDIDSHPELDIPIILDFLKGSPQIKYFYYSIKNHYAN